MEGNGEAFVLDYTQSSEELDAESGEETTIKSPEKTSNPCQNGESDSPKSISYYNISKLSEDAAKKLHLLTQCREECGQGNHTPDSKVISLMNGCDQYDKVNGFTDDNLLEKLSRSPNKSIDKPCTNNTRLNENSDLSDIQQDFINDNAGSTSQFSSETFELDDNISYNCASQSCFITDVHSSQTHQKVFDTERTNDGEVEKSVSMPPVSDSCATSSDYSISDEITKLDNIEYVRYESELQMPDIMRLIQKDLSEPYSIYTYRYFIHNWPELCFLARTGDKCVGAIVCKLDHHHKVKRGYIAMLAVDESYRKQKIGSNLVLKAIQAMIAGEAGEIVLETEITNKPALKLYENLGFVRDKRLFRYYLNGVDALRLKLWIH